MINRLITIVQISIFIIVLFSLSLHSQDQPDAGPLVTVSGNNQLNASYGTIMYDPNKPVDGNGDYLTDYLDFDVGIKSFFVRGTFLVNSPSVGYNPFPNVVNEFFHRRTIGSRTSILLSKQATSKRHSAKG